MSKKASTATKETRRQATSVAEFKKRKKGIPLSLPSGLTVLARRVELRTFLEQGDVPNALLEIVTEALDKGRKMDPKSMMGEEGQVDLEMIGEMYEMVNAVCVQSITKPKCRAQVWTEQDEENEDIPEGAEVGDRIPDEDRDDDLLYTDDIDDTDKMFIFQWAVGGTSDLATFRQESEADLASLAGGKKSGKKSKRSAGAKKG
jgi:hypothetical protein